MTPYALSRIWAFFIAVFMPVDTKSSWSAAAGMDWIDAGAERSFCSTMSVSAVDWLSIIPEYMPAPFVRNAGRPAESAGFVNRFRRRSERTQTVVTVIEAMSIGGAHRPLLADDRRDAPVEPLDERLRDDRPAARVAVGVDVDASRHGRADRLDRRGLADAGRVVVHEVALELRDLLVRRFDLAELADARVDAVHGLAGGDLLLEHARLARMRSRAAGASSTRSPSRATAMRRSGVRDVPSRMIVTGGAGLGTWAHRRRWRRRASVIVATGDGMASGAGAARSRLDRAGSRPSRDGPGPDAPRGERHGVGRDDLAGAAIGDRDVDGRRRCAARHGEPDRRQVPGRRQRAEPIDAARGHAIDDVHPRPAGVRVEAAGSKVRRRLEQVRAEARPFGEVSS